MSRKVLSIAMWLVLAFVFCACRACYLPDRSLSTPLTNADVVGTWQMTVEARQLLERDGFPSTPEQTSTMTFSADGSVDCAFVEYEAGHTYEQRSGTWQLLHHPQGPDESRANVLKLELQRAGDPKRIDVTWEFAEVDGELRLWSFHGDPDSWEFIEYTRVK